MARVPVALKAWARYVVPLTVLSVIALAPLAYLALKSAPAKDLVQARAQVRFGWILAATAWACQLWLVAGVAPAVRSIARGAPLSQWRALTAGLANMARGLVPCAIAIAAVAIGGLAFVIPGLIVLGHVMLTGASERLGDALPAPIADSIATVRAHAKTAVLVVAAVIVVDLAIALAAQMMYVPFIAKKVAAVKLLPIRTFVRVVALALVAISPLCACALAAVSSRDRAEPS